MSLTDEVSASSDEAAIKRLFARAFREWAEGNVEGTAQEIFDAVVTQPSSPASADVPVTVR